MNMENIKRESMGIINQLFDLAEVPVDKRQAINDIADEYLTEQIIRLINTFGASNTIVSEELDRIYTYQRGINKY